MRQIIFGTDWCADCDDAFAARILARAHKRGEIRLLGASINACVDDSVTSLDGFFAREGIDVPIGINLDATENVGAPKYQARLVKYAKKYKSNLEAEDGIRIYRRLIAEADGPVEILEVGFLTNLAGLVESEPDDISPLCGVDLMRSKVTKVWSMAGKWDDQGAKEYNIHFTPRSRVAAATVVEKCPVPIIFLGFEIGSDVISGSKLPDGDDLKNVLIDFGRPGGRSSWDPMTAHLAVVGDVTKAGYTTVRGKASINPETGENYFEKSDTGAHFYLKRLYSPEYYAAVIDEAVAPEKE